MSSNMLSDDKYKYRNPDFINRNVEIKETNLKVHKKIFWPCWRYQVTIRCSCNERINPFEKVVLELMRAITVDEQRISVMTGINEEMVKFIQDLLFQKGYVDDNLKITEVGKEVLRDGEDNVKDNFFFVYQEPYTGELFPVIEAATEEFSKSENWIYKKGSEPENYTFYFPDNFAAVGNKKSDKEPVYGISFKSCDRKIDNKDINNLINRIKNFSHLNINNVSNIRVGNSEAVYVLADYAIDNENNSKDKFTNGFSEEWSSLMEKAFFKINEDDKSYFTSIRKDAELNSEDFTHEEESKNVKELRKRWWFSYDIQENLVDVCKILEEYNNEKVSTKDDIKYFDKKTKELILSLYSALQYCFYYGAKKSLRLASIKNMIGKYDNYDKHIVKKILIERLEKKGFDVTGFGEYLGKKLSPNKVRFAVNYEDNISLWPVFALWCLEYTDERSSFEEMDILEKFKDIPAVLQKLCEIDNLRNIQSHEAKSAKPIMRDKAVELFENVKNIAETVLPERKNNENHEEVMALKEKNRSSDSEYKEMLFKARNKLREFFGAETASNIPDEIYSELENCELAFISDDYDVSTLALILQSIYFNLFLQCERKIDFINKKDMEGIKNHTLANIKNYGFEKGQLKSLETTNCGRLSVAYEKREDISLGINCIMWLYLSSNEEKMNIAGKLPCLINVTNKLISLRGHNGNGQEDVSSQEIGDLRKCVYEFVKILTESGQLSD